MAQLIPSIQGNSSSILSTYSSYQQRLSTRLPSKLAAMARHRKLGFHSSNAQHPTTSLPGDNPSTSSFSPSSWPLTGRGCAHLVASFLPHIFSCYTPWAIRLSLQILQVTSMLRFPLTGFLLHYSFPRLSSCIFHSRVYLLCTIHYRVYLHCVYLYTYTFIVNLSELAFTVIFISLKYPYLCFKKKRNKNKLIPSKNK